MESRTPTSEQLLKALEEYCPRPRYLAWQLLRTKLIPEQDYRLSWRSTCPPAEVITKYVQKLRWGSVIQRQVGTMFFFQLYHSMRDHLDDPISEIASDLVNQLASGEIPLEADAIYSWIQPELNRVLTLPSTDPEACRVFEAFFFRDFCGDVDWWANDQFETLHKNPAEDPTGEKTERLIIIQKVFSTLASCWRPINMR